MVYMVYTLVQLDDPASSSVRHTACQPAKIRYGVHYMAVMILKLVTLGCLILSTLVLATPIISLHGLVMYKYIEKT